MKTISKLIMLLSVAIATACNVNQDNNKSLDYDTLDVQLEAWLIALGKRKELETWRHNLNA